MADTKRDIQMKIKNQAKQIENYAAQTKGARCTDANFVAWVTSIAASITTEIGAYNAANP